jgi:DNA-binding transcriptional MerR regulator
MDEIIELEKKVNISIEKIKLLMRQKTKVPENSTGKDYELSEHLGKLKEENQKLRKEITVLVKEHEVNLSTIDTLLKKLGVILEGKNG